MYLVISKMYIFYNIIIFYHIKTTFSHIKILITFNVKYFYFNREKR